MKLIQKYQAGNIVSTKDCAKYQNDYLRSLGYLISGNAWNLKEPSLLYSGYKGLKKPNKFDESEVIKYNNQASDNVKKNFDSDTLDKNEIYVVNMYFKGSPYQQIAYQEGTDNKAGTHTGYLKYDPKKKGWYVTHNIHGHIHVDNFKAIQGGNKQYGVTTIYKNRPNNLGTRIRTFLGLKQGGQLFNTI